MTLFSARLQAVADQVEAGLDALLSASLLPGESARPQRLLAAMRHGTLGGGKRLRPFLVIETARAVGGSQEIALPVGLAVECVHCYSLIHDDLPAMDNDDLRRGRPTVHKAYDDATAILAGDALLTLAFDQLMTSRASAETKVALCLGLARAAGIGGMVGGQMLDIEAEAATTPLDAAEILRLQAMKTGALLRFAVDAGTLIGQATPSQRQALQAYGTALGSAFQIADDILDAESTTQTLGKQAGKDAGRNKGTFVSIHGLAGAKDLRDRFVAQATRALEDAGLPDQGALLRETVHFVAARTC